MVAKIDVISEASHKHAGEVVALAFDGEHLYSGSADGVINVWDKDLKFAREIAIHKEFPILALAINKQKQIFSSGRDGSLRHFKRPWSHDTNDIMLQTVADDVTCLHVADNILYSGDDKGIVTKWYHNQVGCQYNVMEEVRSMAVEGTTLYTVRETDVVITDITPGLMQHVTKGTLPGRAPLLLHGRELLRRASTTNEPVRRGSYITAEMNRRASNVTEIDESNLRHKYIIYATRDGKGFSVATNESPYKEVVTKSDAHSMIINAMCDTEEFLFTAGYDGKVKKWKDLEKDPKLVEEIDTGKCINTLIVGPDHTVFVGDSDGFVKRLRFSSDA